MKNDLASLIPDLDSATGKGVRIVVVDSGVEIDHPALKDFDISSWRVDELEGPKFKVVKDKGQDVFGHGTAVAAILKEHAPDAQVDSLRVLGGDLRSTSQHVIAGVEWAIKQGYDIINCSFGSPNEKFLPDYKRLVDNAYIKNCLLVSACNNMDFRKTEYPGAFPSVISTDWGKLEPHEIKRRLGYLVEFVARGDNIKVAWKGKSYRTNTGSSFAAPHLAAFVARMRQRRPDWNACEMKSAIYLMAPLVKEKRRAEVSE